jgi:subtilisin family serine protease
VLTGSARFAALLRLSGALLALTAGTSPCPASARAAAGTRAGLAGTAAGPAVTTAGHQVRADDLAELGAIGVPAAWRLTRGRGVTVAVLDTGTDPAVPDLSGSVTTGPDFTRGANPPGFRPSRWHGTFIASLIAGHGSGPGRASGIVGVAPAARILAVRVILDANEPGFPVYNANDHYEQAIGSGIRYAVRHGAGVINMSLGSATGARPVRRAVGYAISHGVVVVASAGNDGARPGKSSPLSYPASFTGVISVAAVGAGHRRAPFSDRNASVVISAPGVDITGAAPGGGYLAVNGTSPAAAFVAGVAALIRSRYPRLGPALVRQALVESARHRPARGYSPGVGFGEVDAGAALRVAGLLAARPTVAGLAPAARFGAGPLPGPVQVTRRDAAGIAASKRIEAAGGLGFAAGLLILAVIICRGRRKPGAAAGKSLAGAETRPDRR